MLVFFFSARVSGQNFSIIHSLSSQEGNSTYSSLTEAKDGTIYGIVGPNPSFQEMIFKLAADGSLVKLVGFSDTNNPTFPVSLTQADDGFFYGALSPAITSGKFGTIFRMASDGTLTTMATFNGTNGGLCYVPLIVGCDSNIYGTTIDPNVNYKWKPPPRSVDLCL